MRSDPQSRCSDFAVFMVDEGLLDGSATVMRVFIVASAVLLGAIALIGLVTWSPPVHPISTPGTRPVKAHEAGGFGPWTDVPAPTMSLSALRCDIWHSRTRTVCPDDATLAQRMWPALAQTPQTIYVSRSSDSLAGPLSNVEYESRTRTLIIHSCGSRPLLLITLAPQREGTRMQPSLDLLAVSTDGIPAGKLNVAADWWIERLTGDEQNGITVLGTVEIG